MSKLFNLHTHTDQRDPDEIAIQDCSPVQIPLNTYFSISLHPWSLDKEMLGQVIDFMNNNPLENFIAIGECGLDKLCDTPFELQIGAFNEIVTLSELYQKPLIIHCVKAFDELIAIKNKLNPTQPWIIHGFRGKPAQGLQLIKQGFCLSFGPKYNSETIKVIPLWAFFIETDNSVVSIQAIYESIASELNITFNQLTEAILENAKKYLKITI